MKKSQRVGGRGSGGKGQSASAKPATDNFSPEQHEDAITILVTPCAVCNADHGQQCFRQRARGAHRTHAGRRNNARVQVKNTRRRLTERWKQKPSARDAFTVAVVACITCEAKRLRPCRGFEDKPGCHRERYAAAQRRITRLCGEMQKEEERFLRAARGRITQLERPISAEESALFYLEAHKMLGQRPLPPSSAYGRRVMRKLYEALRAGFTQDEILAACGRARARHKAGYRLAGNLIYVLGNMPEWSGPDECGATAPRNHRTSAAIFSSPDELAERIANWEASSDTPPTPSGQMRKDAADGKPTGRTDRASHATPPSDARVVLRKREADTLAALRTNRQRAARTS